MREGGREGGGGEGVGGDQSGNREEEDAGGGTRQEEEKELTSHLTHHSDKDTRVKIIINKSRRLFHKRQKNKQILFTDVPNYNYKTCKTG